MPKHILYLYILAISWGAPGCLNRPPVDVQALQAAKTAEAEAAAFEALVKDATTLGFIARDATGHKLRGSDAPWSDQVVSVTIRVDGTVVEHNLIDPENVSRLLGE